MPNQEGIELSWIFEVIRRRWWIIVGCTLLAAMLAFAITSQLPPVYRATVTILIEPARDTRTSEYNILVAGERLALTYSEMLKGQPVLEAVISRLGLEETPETLAEMITAEPIADTQLILLTVTDSSPTKATLLANTLAEAFIAHIQTLVTQRYTASLSSMQEKIGVLFAQIEETQSNIDTLRVGMIGDEAEVVRLQNLLDGYRNDHRALQQDYLALQLTVAELKKNVNVFEAAHVLGNQISPPYTAKVTFILADEGLALTYGQMLTGRSVLEATTAQLGLTESPDALAQRVLVEPVPETQLIQLSVQDTDASRATLLADTIAENFISQIQALVEEPYADRLAEMEAYINLLSTQMDQTQAVIETLVAKNVQRESDLARLEDLLAEYRLDYRALTQDYEELRMTAADAAESVVIAQPAEVPESPIQRQILYIILGAAFGTMMGLGFAFLLEYLDSTIRTPDDVSQLLHLATLGTIGRLENGEEELIVVAQPRSPISESFRLLGTNIRLSSREQPLQTLLVTSPTNTEGKSLIVANLAVTMARTGLKVVAVDADLRLPRQHELFGLDQGEGLSESLLEGGIDGNLQPTQVEGLRVLTSGEVPPNPAELMSSPQLAELLDGLTKVADLVLIDSPPILPVADTTILASETDGVLLILRAGHTYNRAARDTVESLHQVGAHLVGVVLNAASNQGNRYYSYYGRKSKEAETRVPRWKQPLVAVTQLFRRK
jgi:succinoglycan biosynthesis transport protein ExoP